MSDWHVSMPVQLRRKPCMWCGESLDNGPAVKHVGTFEGSFYAGHMHTECDAAFQRQDPDVLCDGWDYYSFQRGSVEFR